MKEKCFADRKDGTCHALKRKECENCKFYFPRKLLRNNPLYEYSYMNESVFLYDVKTRKIPIDLIMKKED